MRDKFTVNVSWLRKAAICVAFLVFATSRCHAQLGLPPLITAQPLGATVQSGSTATMSVTVGVSLTPLSFKWRLNGSTLAHPNVMTTTIPILGTTICTLTITNCSAANAGNYSVKVGNSGGEVTSGNALLVVLTNSVSNVGPTTVSLLTSGSTMTSGGFQLQLVKPANSNCVVEASTDLKNWTSIYTNSTSYTNISWVDSAATNMSFRYYRARLQ